jgi:transposase
MDEARFGTHSKLGHGWFQTGIRSRINIKLGFKNFYMYSAVEPISGEIFSLKLPRVNTDMMNIFLQEIAKHYNGEHLTIIMDGAGWHKSKKLNKPDNIDIIHLPPYSPELNPVERLWQYIKNNTIKNKIYESLEQLEDIVCEFIGHLTNDIIAQICATNWSN